MVYLPEEQLVVSTVFSNVDVDFFGPFIVQIGQRNKNAGVAFSHALLYARCI